MQVFLILLVAGLILICSEIFIPGGMMGIIGLICLIGAAIAGFVQFGASGGFFASLGILVTMAAAVILWLRYFPKSRIGKAMTLTNDGKNFKSCQSMYGDLMGKTGKAETELRPSGSATVDGRRVDVVTEGDLVPRGAPVKVIKVAGNRIVVRAVESEEHSKEDTEC